MAHARTPRRAWIEQGLEALAGGGPDAVRVEALAQSLGVTKGGFYGYFANRAALLEEMLATWECEVTEVVISEVEAGAGPASARTKLRRLFAIADAEHATIGVAVDLAIRDWARRDRQVAARLARVDSRQMDYLRSLFSEFCRDALEVEARCLVVMSIRIGDHLIPAEHGRHRRAEIVRDVLNRLLV